jgi:EAL domain-containing protein (putative c-di-GMP-specific phosphodiesterase class I)
VQSWSRVVDDILRTGSSASFPWDGCKLTTHFQPVHGVRRPHTAGYEALLRAHDAAGNPVAPEVLLREAARSGRLLLLDRACRALHLHNFARVDPGHGRLFLNVTPDAAVADAAAPREFTDLVRYYGLVPKRVCLEVLEHGCDDEPALAAAVAAYRDQGMAIAIDDFGTGCSNFDRLAALRPELVKVERSMLAEAVGESKSRGMMAPLIAMLRESGAQIVVEAVESPQEALMAIDAGATYLQGNYLAAPAAGIASDEYILQVLHKLLEVGSPRVALAAG